MRKYSKSKRQSKTMKGGNGAAEYAEKVYGSAGNQNADPNNGNVIAMNRVVGGNLPGLTPCDYKGGKKQKKQQEKKGGEPLEGEQSEQQAPLQGGKVLNEIALPAVLLVANQTLGKRRTMRNTKKQFRKNRRSNRFRRSMRR